MKSLLNAKTDYLSTLPKGTLFALRTFRGALEFGIKLSAPDEQPDGWPKVLLLNPARLNDHDPIGHQVHVYEHDERCISLGTDWVIDPDFTANALSGINEPQPDAALTIGLEGIYFRAAPAGGRIPFGRQHFHVETQEFVRDLENAAFYLTSYRLFLSKEDALNGRAPIYSHGLPPANP